MYTLSPGGQPDDGLNAPDPAPAAPFPGTEPIAGPEPPAPEAEPATPNRPKAPRTGPRGLRWETRVGLAAVLSFGIVVAVAVTKRGWLRRGTAPTETAASEGSGSKPKNKQDRPKTKAEPSTQRPTLARNDTPSRPRRPSSPPVNSIAARPRAEPAALPELPPTAVESHNPNGLRRTANDADPTPPPLTADYTRREPLGPDPTAPPLSADQPLVASNDAQADPGPPPADPVPAAESVATQPIKVTPEPTTAEPPPPEAQAFAPSATAAPIADQPPAAHQPPPSAPVALAPIPGAGNDLPAPPPEPAPTAPTAEPAPAPAAGAMTTNAIPPQLDPTPTPAAEPARPTGSGTTLPNAGMRRLQLAGAPPTADAPEPAAKPVPIGGRFDPKRHIVQPGESFFTISQMYYRSGRFYKALWKANQAHVPRIDELYVGTVIVIPMLEDLDRALIEPTPAPRTLGGAASAQPATSSVPGPRRLASTPNADDSAAEPGLIAPEPARAAPGRDRDRPRRGPTYTVRDAYETPRSVAARMLGDAHREDEIRKLNLDLIGDTPYLPVGARIALPGDAGTVRR